MTPDELTARRQVNDTARSEKLGVIASKQIAQRLKSRFVSAFRSSGRPLNVRQWLIDNLGQLVRDAMIAADLRGRKRAIIQRQKAKKGLKLGVYDEVIAILQRQLNVDLDALQLTYETEALRVLNGVSDVIERDLRATVNSLIVEGATVREARDVLSERFSALGLDPKAPHQLETIFRTQSQIAFGAGRWVADQDPDIQEILWGYKYVTVGDNRVRPSHAALEGVTLPKDHPFWQTFFPPNGWGCRCQAIALFDERRLVLPPSDAQPDRGFNFNPGIALSV